MRISEHLQVGRNMPQSSRQPCFRASVLQIAMCLLLGVLSAGCRTLNKTEFCVPDSEANREAVASILRATAAEYGFTNRTQERRELYPHLLVSYIEMGAARPMLLKASTNGTSICASISHVKKKKRRTNEYKTIEGRLTQEFTNNFGDKAIIKSEDVSLFPK